MRLMLAFSGWKVLRRSCARIPLPSSESGRYVCIRKRLSLIERQPFSMGEGRLELVSVFQVMQAFLWLRDGDHILGLLVEEVGLVHVEGQINDLAWRMEIARVHTGNEFCCADFTVKHGFSTQ